VAVEKRVRFKSWWLPWALVAPQLAIVLVFFFWPAAQALYQSVLREDAFGTSSEFVGLENFKALLDDDSYLASFKVTAVFSFWVALLGLALSLMLAVMADRVVKGSRIYQTLLVWPYAVAPAVAGVLWLFMFAPSVGVVSFLLRGLGIEWNHAMVLVVLTAVWSHISYNFLFFLAGLQSIPKSLIEAAAIDGAGPWRRFWTVQFPLLTPTTFFLLVINVIYVLIGTFGIIDAATSGGPGQETSILVYKVYFDGFKAMDLGGSATQSVVLMVILVALTVIQFRYIERRVHY
jgi:sn-glycerol 3-phosphate transport system permease protein